MDLLERLRLTKLSPHIGAAVEGLDLSRPLDAATCRWLRTAWLDHCILLFRGQSLSEDDQVRFAGCFGTVVERVLNARDAESRIHPGVMFVSNIRENGQLIGALPDGEMMFHSDQCYVEKPGMASMLYAIEVPSRGGNTSFANMYRAYETLPPEWKHRLAGRVAMNVYDYDKNPTQRGSSGGGLRHAHPVFRTHPETGRKALYVNRLMTDHIVGMDREESDRALEYLFEHLESPEWIYEHVWSPGDLVMWDNRCAVHARSDFDGSERRLMRRCVLAGDVPFG